VWGGITVGALGWWERWVSRGEAQGQRVLIGIQDQSSRVQEPWCRKLFSQSREYHRLRYSLSLATRLNGFDLPEGTSYTFRAMNDKGNNIS
ncbi:MAG: hypothetical protein K2L11_04975, partial [Muribaculaceae bacterium]|nr:hypothetical protein [Muribaculaceae bacterium]